MNPSSDKRPVWLYLTETSTGRVTLALLLSLLIHILLLFGPTLIELKPAQVELPPLTAKLEPLPAAPSQIKPRAPAKPKQPPAPVRKTPPAAAPSSAPLSSVSPAEPPGLAPESAKPTEATEAVELAVPAYPLPRHAQLTFIAYKGTGFQVGEARHRLEIKEDKSYTLQVGMNTTGLASLFKTFDLNQESLGKISPLGLQPEVFTENKVTSKGQQRLSANFDRANKQLIFSSGNQAILPEGTQDILSFLYQFSQIPLNQATLTMPVSNGKKLEVYQLEIGSEEDIPTRLGSLRGLPLRKIHAPGEEGLEIWLGLAYRLLPVKVRQIDRNGEIAGELVISDIRVSDE